MKTTCGIKTGAMKTASSGPRICDGQHCDRRSAICASSRDDSNQRIDCRVAAAAAAAAGAAARAAAVDDDHKKNLHQASARGGPSSNFGVQKTTGNLVFYPLKTPFPGFLNFPGVNVISLVPGFEVQ